MIKWKTDKYIYECERRYAMAKITAAEFSAVLAVLVGNIDLSRLHFDQARLAEFVIGDPILAGEEFLRFLQNGGRVHVVGEHIIDCDAAPSLPKGLTLEYHKKGGKLLWNPKDFKLRFHPEQENGVVGGYTLREWLKNEPIYNANVLDYWLAHPYIIPLECKGKWTYFWNTIFSDPDGTLYVRYLDWVDDQPISGYCLLDYGFSTNSPAAGFVRERPEELETS